MPHFQDGLLVDQSFTASKSEIQTFTCRAPIAHSPRAMHKAILCLARIIFTGLREVLRACMVLAAICRATWLEMTNLVFIF